MWYFVLDTAGKRLVEKIYKAFSDRHSSILGYRNASPKDNVAVLQLKPAGITHERHSPAVAKKRLRYRMVGSSQDG
jgi:hypothetical protein